MLKKFNSFLFLGILLIILHIWSKLRKRLPQNMPLDIQPEWLNLCFKTIPIVLFILLLVLIKKFYFPKESKFFFIKKIQNFLAKPLLYLSHNLDLIYMNLGVIFVNRRSIILRLHALFNLIVGGSYLKKNKNSIYFSGKKIGMEGKNVILSGEYSDIPPDAADVPTKNLKLAKIVHIALAFILELVIYAFGIYEIYFHGKLDAFYSLLPLLLIPLAWRGYLYILSMYYSLWCKEKNDDPEKGQFIRLFDVNFNILEKNLNSDYKFIYSSPFCKYFILFVVFDILKNGQIDYRVVNIESTPPEFETFTQTQLFKERNWILNHSFNFLFVDYLRNSIVMKKYSLILLLLRIIFLVGLFYEITHIIHEITHIISEKIIFSN
jgi:hypothetical protein